MRTLALALFAAGCAYDAPLDPNATPILGSLTGSVLYAGTGQVDAPTYVILFRADAPAPPDGTGSPLTFAAIPPEAYTLEGGMQSAPYALTRIPEGAYQVNALVDTDGDFNPFSSALAGATCGDWGGTHLTDLVTQQWAPVQVFDRHVSDDVTVIVGQQLPIERPSFELATQSLSLGDILTGAAPPLFRLRSTAVAAAFSEDLVLELGPNCAPPADAPPYFVCGAVPACPCDLPTIQPCGTNLLVQVMDADADGQPDLHPDPALAQGGVLDIWPRVYLEYAGELPTYEHEGQELRERWVSQGFVLQGEVATLVGQGLDPAAALGAMGVPVGLPLPTYELSVTFVPVFRHYHADGVLLDANGPFDVVELAADPTAPVPTGGWAVTLVASSGQTWTLPNDIGLLGLPSLDPGFDPVAQAAALAILE